MTRHGVVLLEESQFAGELVGDGRCAEVEAFQHQRHDIALGIEGSFDLAAQPVVRVAATLQRGGREQDEEVRSRMDVFEDDGLEVAAGDAGEVEEDVVAVVGQVLGNRQRPGSVGAAIADENGFLDACHG